jgi:hypothetical protein
MYSVEYMVFVRNLERQQMKLVVGLDSGNNDENIHARFHTDLIKVYFLYFSK